MNKVMLVLLILFIGAAGCFAFAGTPPKGDENVSKYPKVQIETSKGKITIELYDDKAPISVKNFIGYVETGFYDGTIFHRVIPGFMVQGGGMTSGLKEKMVLSPIKNEAGNGLKNLRGTLAMARTNVVDSATAQFFINSVDNAFLDHQDDTVRGYGYCVFGKVIDGMDIVDLISQVKTHSVGYYDDVPVEDVTIISAKKL